MNIVQDTWDGGDAYEQYVGRWSAPVARQFVEWLAIEPGRKWLDLGCGTGALTAAILELAQPASVTCVDPAPTYLEYARDRLNNGRVQFTQGTAEVIPVTGAAVEASVSGLALNFMDDAAAAVRDMRRVTRPGGTVAAYVWDYAGRMDFMRIYWDEATIIDPDAPDEGIRFPICNPEGLTALFKAAGLGQIATQPVDVDTIFSGFDDYWRPFLGGQGAAGAHLMSLDDSEREALRFAIAGRLPFSGDGSIQLLSRAWAVRGIV